MCAFAFRFTAKSILPEIRTSQVQVRITRQGQSEMKETNGLSDLAPLIQVSYYFPQFSSV